MAGMIRTFLTDKQKINRPAIILIWSFGTYAEQFGFKKNTNVVYATNISKITNFSKCLKDRTITKYKFVNSFNVKKDYKQNWRNKVINKHQQWENWRNKGINKHQQPDSSIHDTTNLLSLCGPSFNFVCLSVSEKR